ncbi:glycosyltransferase [Glutamicibacter sp. NPDC087583]|uniref:glycosyltransferase n=1 Tax=Glutamicibacter sp. NPDC087583 TaxID=3363995 RepID=UPI00381BB052
MNLRKVLVYGDVNLNIIDGSAIWLTSISEALLLAGVQVHVLLKTKVSSNDSLERLSQNANFVIHQPTTVDIEPGESSSLSPRKAAQRILGLDSEHHFSAIIARGMTVCKFIAMSERLHRRSWLYVTDLPFPIEKVSEKSLDDLNIITAKAYRLFSQTEESRAYLEALCPQAAGKTRLMSPMVPDIYFEEFDDAIADDSISALKLIYAGKFAEDWKTLEMLSLPEKCQNSGVNVQLTMVGNKFQQSRRDPKWHEQMESGIVDADVSWLGGLSRHNTMLEIRKADLGLGWRTSALDSSMEISTKALEYAASGIPPVVNRTRAHEEIFGEDYPFFVTDEIESVVEMLDKSRNKIDAYKSKVRDSVSRYSMTSAAKRFEAYFERDLPVNTPVRGKVGSVRVLLAGHDFKFCGELIQYLEASPNVELVIDKWSTLHKHDQEESRKLLNDADVVICEWAGPNAVWYSQNVGIDQRLYVRLHAFELRGAWLKDISIKNVSKVLCVSDLYAGLTADITNWPEEKIAVIPNLIDCLDLDRPKAPESEYRIGLVGIVPFIKRPDRAVKLLSSLLEHDSRYTLHIRGRMPWEYTYEWNKGLQRYAYEEFFEAIASDPKLSNSVVFEDFGPDMGSWFRKIGVVLSCSTRESFHLAPIEGMAGGAVPVVWDRPGAEEIFSEEFVHDSIEEMTDFVLGLRASSTRTKFVEKARNQARKYDVTVGAQLWAGLIAKEMSA